MVKLNLTLLIASILMRLGVGQDAVVNVPIKTTGEFDMDTGNAQFYAQIFNKDENICGGTVLSHFVILTAAHCCSQIFTVCENLKDYHVVAGVDKPNTTRPNHELEHFVTHPQFVKTIELKKNLYDIAVVTVRKPLDHSIKIAPSFLPQPVTKPLAVGTEVLVFGIGETKSPTKRQASASNLRGIKLAVIDDKACKDIVNNNGHKYFPDQICVGNANVTDKDMCQKDSGSPVIFNSILFGINSWGLGCKRLGNPTIFTTVLPYMKWIRDTAKQVGNPIN